MANTQSVVDPWMALSGEQILAELALWFRIIDGETHDAQIVDDVRVLEVVMWCCLRCRQIRKNSLRGVVLGLAR